MVVAMIGIGHIGGSLAIALRENGFAGEVIGVDRQPETLNKALRRRLIDRTLPLDEAVAAADLVVLATPVDGMLELLPKVLDRVEQQVVMDVGSTKEQLLRVVKDHPRRARFVATHPMAGRKNSGVEAAVADLFTGKFTVLCDVEASDADAVSVVERLYGSIPMQIVYLDGRAHDLHTAYVSHISHISSFALALTVLAKETDEDRIFELASSGFDSTVRLAKSSPDMWVPIFRQNRDFVLDVLDEHINTLALFRSYLIKSNFDGIRELIEKANRIRTVLRGAPQNTAESQKPL